MKRISLFGLVLCVVLMGVFMGCKNKKGEPTEPAGQDVVDPTPTPDPYNGHSYVDLGLPSGTLWATCNVGATTPEGYGDYFAWGEIAPKSDYSWATYMHANDAADKLTKYCNDASKGNNGYTDELAVLELTDDAARANWGGKWRMPTIDEIQELLDNCTWVWSAYNDVMGYNVETSNGSIFLPAAGYRYGTESRNAGSRGYYWSSTLDNDVSPGYGPNYACDLQFTSEYHAFFSDPRSDGRPVRAVCTR